MVRARHKVSDLLRRSRDGRTGLVVFAGDAFVVAPLTRDADTLVHLLSAIDTSVVPVQGSRPDLGLASWRSSCWRRVSAAIGRGRARHRRGEGSADPRHRRDARRARGIPGVGARGGHRGGRAGAAGGGRLSQGDERRDRRAAGRHAAALARGGRGRQGSVLDGHRGRRRRRLAARVTRVDDPWRPSAGGGGPHHRRVARRGAVAGAGAAAAGGARVPAGLAAGVRRSPPRSRVASRPATLGAFELADLWARRDQQAARAIERGDTDRAAAVAPDHRWRGTALYRGGRYDESAGGVRSGATAPRTTTTAGIALARAGDLRGALDAWGEALARALRSTRTRSTTGRSSESLLEARPEPRGGDGERDRRWQPGAGLGGCGGRFDRESRPRGVRRRMSCGPGRSASSPAERCGAGGGRQRGAASAARSAPASAGSRGNCAPAATPEVDAGGGGGSAASRGPHAESGIRAPGIPLGRGAAARLRAVAAPHSRRPRRACCGASSRWSTGSGATGCRSAATRGKEEGARWRR